MSWPTLERSALESVVEEHLSARPSRAVMLRGPSGIGKTTLARRVALSWQERGFTVVAVAGLAELADAPLAALAPLHSLLGLDPGATAREVIASVGARAGEVVMIVDDAPLLDGASAAVVHQLVRAYAVPTVMTARSDQSIAGPIERLLAEDLVTVVDVEGLGREEIGEVLRRRLEGSPRPDDVSRLNRLTGGNPLHLREVVNLAEQRGLVHRTDWGVEVEPFDVPPGLSASVAAHVEALGHESRVVLSRVAVGSSAPASVIISGPAERGVVERLVADGFVEVRPRDVVRVTHPAYAEAALASLSVREHDEVVGDVAARLEATGDEALRFAAVQLRSDTSAGPTRAQMEWSVRHAQAVGESLVAVDAAQRALAMDPSVPLGFGAAVDRASALSTLGRLDEADQAFEAAEDVAEGSADLALLVMRKGAHLAYRRFDVAASLALVERIEPRLDEADRALVAPDRRTWGLLLGETTGARARALEPGVESTPEVLVRAAMSSVMLDSMGGRTTGEAAEVLRAVERQFGVLDPFAASMVHLQRFFTLLSLGEGAESARVCEEQRAEAGPDAVGMWSLTLGIHRMYGGRLAEARALAELAVEQLRWRDPMGFLGHAIALRADVAAQFGDRAEVERLLDLMVPSQLAEPKTGMLAAEARALVAAHDGDVDTAARIIEEAAARALAAGHDLVAAISLGICLRLGKVDVAAPMLTQIRSGVDEGLLLYRSLGDTADAMLAEDPLKVLAGARALAAAGMVVAAIDAVHVACDFPAARAGEVRRRLDRHRLAWEKQSEAGPLRGATDGDVLSAREWEVAELVQSRWSSREIGLALGISARTVDNHLARVYRKLGVAGRADLRRELDADPR